MIAGGNIADAVGATQATHSWLYDYVSGDFHVNCQALSSDEVTTYLEF
jgi:hypothetical protein